MLKMSAFFARYPFAFVAFLYAVGLILTVGVGLFNVTAAALLAAGFYFTLITAVAFLGVVGICGLRRR